MPRYELTQRRKAQQDAARSWELPAGSRVGAIFAILLVTIRRLIASDPACLTGVLRWDGQWIACL